MGPVQVRDEEFATWWRDAGQEQLGEILYWEWDPIGINPAFPATRGEYDGYPEQIAAELRKGRGRKDVEAVLLHRAGHDGLGTGAHSRGASAPSSKLHQRELV
jgi:hypothetical protein